MTRATVYIPGYSVAQFIARAIDSLIAQSYAADESHVCSKPVAAMIGCARMEKTRYFGPLRAHGWNLLHTPFARATHLRHDSTRSIPWTITGAGGALVSTLIAMVRASGLSSVTQFSFTSATIS